MHVKCEGMIAQAVENAPQYSSKPVPIERKSKNLPMKKKDQSRERSFRPEFQNRSALLHSLEKFPLGHLGKKECVNALGLRRGQTTPFRRACKPSQKARCPIRPEFLPSAHPGATLEFPDPRIQRHTTRPPVLRRAHVEGDARTVRGRCRYET